MGIGTKHTNTSGWRKEQKNPHKQFWMEKGTRNSHKSGWGRNKKHTIIEEAYTLQIVMEI